MSKHCVAYAEHIVTSVFLYLAFRCTESDFCYQEQPIPKNTNLIYINVYESDGVMRWLLLQFKVVNTLYSSVSVTGISHNVLMIICNFVIKPTQRSSNISGDAKVYIVKFEFKSGGYASIYRINKSILDHRIVLKVHERDVPGKTK